ncbi:MAG: peptidase M23, partial [Bacteroidota bacterium]
ELEETKKAVARLDKLIAEIVREELERAARETKKSTVKSAAVALTSASFEGNKSKFGWPVNGFISQRFGKQKHPVLPKVEIWNDGINIQTGEGEKVRSIFKG